MCDLLSRLLNKEPSNRPQSVREVKNHPWFAGINWNQLSRKEYKAPFVPKEVMKAKFFKEHNAWPQNDQEYIFDTRFFSPKQTKKDTEPLQKIIDELQTNK